MKMMMSLGLCLLALTAGGCHKKPTQPPPPPPIIEINYGAKHYEASWSPDGNKILFALGENNYDSIPIWCYYGLYFINTDSSNIEPFITYYMNPIYGYAMCPDWSPDGEWIVFEINLDLYKIKINRDSLTQLTNEGCYYYPAWSPGGDKIAFFRMQTAGYGGIWVMNADGSDKKYLGGGWARYPSWYQDNIHVLCSREHSDRTELLKINIVTGDTAGKLIFANESIVEAKPSPDGTKIVYTNGRVTAQLPQIWVMNSDGTNQIRLTGEDNPAYYGGEQPDWSPDGTKIVYSFCNSKDNGYLWIMNTDGTNKHQITHSIFTKRNGGIR